MAVHSSILAWKILWIEEPGGLQSMELQRVRHDWLSVCTHTHTYTHTHMTEQRVKSCPEGWEKTSHLHWVKESLLVKYRKAAFVLPFNQRGLNPPFFGGVGILFWFLIPTLRLSNRLHEVPVHSSEDTVQPEINKQNLKSVNYLNLNFFWKYPEKHSG